MSVEPDKHSLNPKVKSEPVFTGYSRTQSDQSAMQPKQKSLNYLKRGTSAKLAPETVKEVGNTINASSYEVLALLGVGSQGRVYLVRLIESGELFAMKVFMKDRIIPNAKTTRSIMTEHRFLATTDHPFVTKLYHSFHTHERLFMVMEYCPGGELFTTIRNQPNGRLTEAQVQFFASEVVLVLEYVHSKGYIYRDLKPENILLHLDGHIRMADFGLSKQATTCPQITLFKRKQSKRGFFGSSKSSLDISQGEVLRTNSLVGSVHYLAPEVLSVHDSYDVMADWWAFGVLLYDMLFGFPPFQGRCSEEIITKIVQCDYEFPPDLPISSSLKSLIKGLLKLDPKKRICAKHGASDIKCHPFFEGTHWGLLRHRPAPIIPKISSLEDTSNFEIYDGDEDEFQFQFFSDLPENPDLIAPEDQTKFSEFNYTRSCFAESYLSKTGKAVEPSPAPPKAEPARESSSSSKRSEKPKLIRRKSERAKKRSHVQKVARRKSDEEEKVDYDDLWEVGSWEMDLQLFREVSAKPSPSPLSRQQSQDDKNQNQNQNQNQTIPPATSDLNLGNSNPDTIGFQPKIAKSKSSAIV